MRLSILAFCLFALGCQTTPAEDYANGRQWVEKSQNLEKESRQNMLEANNLRKKVSSLHIEKRKSKDSTRKNEISKSIKEHTNSINNLRKSGSKNRTKAAKAKKRAVAKLSRGLKANYSQWVTTRSPMGLIGDSDSQAHNTIIRTVFSSRGGVLTGKPGEEQNAPDDLDLNTFRLSREQKMIGHVEVHNEDGANPAGVPLNKIHKWRLIVSDLQGQPIEAEFKVIGHMPGHVHGLPTQPIVTGKLAPGVYLIEGMKFQMQGWWVIEFDTGDDRLRFDFAI